MRERGMAQIIRETDPTLIFQSLEVGDDGVGFGLRHTGARHARVARVEGLHPAFAVDGVGIEDELFQSLAVIAFADISQVGRAAGKVTGTATGLTKRGFAVLDFRALSIGPGEDGQTSDDYDPDGAAQKSPRAAW